MSDTVKKYEELLEEGRELTNTLHQRNTMTIIEILRASDCAGNIGILLEKATRISKRGPNLSPTTVFQIAGEEAKVDELCNKKKQTQWNNLE
jgi:hypothetical protein